jgi:hypothetical protein
MAAGINSLSDSNKDTIAKTNEAMTSGKKLPKTVEESWGARDGDDVGDAEVPEDKAVKAAFTGMDSAGKDTKAP